MLYYVLGAIASHHLLEPRIAHDPGVTESPWDRFASSYGRQLFLERAALRAHLDLLRIRRDERLLDVATGPGVMLAELARRDERPHAAVGVDSSAEMLRHAPPLPAGWSLEQADATRLPYADESFDVVVSSYLLHVIKEAERRAAVAEMARVVRPGGRVGTITVAPPRSTWMTVLTAPLRARAQRSGGRFCGLRPLDPSADLEAAGLRIVAQTRSFRGYPSLCMVSERASRA